MSINHDKKERPFSWIDYVTITISVVALSISAVGSYFTFFHEKTDVGIIVLGITPGEHDFVLEVAAVNTGTQHVALTDAYMYLVQMDGSEILRQQIPPIHDDPKTFPILVQPSKVALFELRAAANWDTVVAYRQEVEPGDDHSHKTILGVQVNALGATGTFLRGVNDAVNLELRGKELGGYSTNKVMMPMVTSDKKPIEHHKSSR